MDRVSCPLTAYRPMPSRLRLDAQPIAKRSTEQSLSFGMNWAPPVNTEMPTFQPVSLPVGVNTWPTATRGGFQLPDSQQMQILGMTSWLGILTQLEIDGSVRYNEPLTSQLASYGTQAFPALKTLISVTTRLPAIREGFYTLEKMSDAGTDITPMYPALERWNSHPDPGIQMHLARLYRRMNESRAFGPMISTLVNYALTQYPMQSSSTFNVSEEIGITVLDQLARKTAAETVRALQPYLQTGTLAPTPVQDFSAPPKKQGRWL